MLFFYSDCRLTAQRLHLFVLNLIVIPNGTCLFRCSNLTFIGLAHIVQPGESTFHFGNLIDAHCSYDPIHPATMACPIGL